MQLLEEKNYQGSFNRIYQLNMDIGVKVYHPELVTCFRFCQNKDIIITDIIFEEINKNTGYNVAWQHCVRYDLDDFHNTFKNIEQFLKQHDTRNFTGWCVIFKANNKEYSISSQDEQKIVLHCSEEIDIQLEPLINQLF